MVLENDDNDHNAYNEKKRTRHARPTVQREERRTRSESEEWAIVEEQQQWHTHPALPTERVFFPDNNEFSILILNGTGPGANLSIGLAKENGLNTIEVICRS